jgi:hypothetical protein
MRQIGPHTSGEGFIRKEELGELTEEISSSTLFHDCGAQQNALGVSVLGTLLIFCPNYTPGMDMPQGQTGMHFGHVPGDWAHRAAQKCLEC